MKLCLIVLALLGATLATKSYSGYKVLQTKPVTLSSLPQLHLLMNNPRFDFWSTPRIGRSAVVMAAPADVTALYQALSAASLSPSLYIADVQQTLNQNFAENEAVKLSEKKAPREITYDRFMDVDEIMAAIHEVADANPSIASTFDVATSTEGRGVHGLKISSGSGRKSVWIDCAIHAREWISPPVCLKTIEMVVASSELQDLADWYISPVSNPDGYAYSWSDDRLWRKTRRPNPNSCVGTDGNRNFDFLWNSDNNNNFCSLTYPGDRPYSEPECQGIADMVSSLAQGGNLAIYLTMHSYGALMLYPYGHTNEPVPNMPELQAAGDEAADIIAQYRGTRYDVGASGETLYYTYGASDDWAYGVAGVQYSYTFELPGGGSAGFNPPPSAIVPCVEETWPGIESLVRRAVAAA